MSAIETESFLRSLYGDLSQDWPKKFDAILTADGLPPSIGIFSLESEAAWPGHYQPNDKNNLNIYPLHRAVLTLKGKKERLLVTSIQPCSETGLYHIWFEAES